MSIAQMVRENRTLEAYVRLYHMWTAADPNSAQQRLASRYLGVIREKHLKVYARIIL